MDVVPTVQGTLGLPAPSYRREGRSKLHAQLHNSLAHRRRRSTVIAEQVAKGTAGRKRAGVFWAVVKGAAPRSATAAHTPRNTLNSLNSRTGRAVTSRQTMLIGRSPSADSSSSGPQAR